MRSGGRAADRQPSPPTRLQADNHITGRTPSPSTRLRGGGESPSTDPSQFPDDLRDRYVPAGLAGHGGEGQVWRAHRTGDGREVAVKVNRPGIEMPHELLQHLGEPAFRRHVPEIIEFGTLDAASDRRDWVAMEYLPETLADVIHQLLRPNGSVNAATARRIIAELAAVLHFWQQQIKRNPTDLKPANVLVRPGRRGSPGEYVISDFGGIAAFTVSQRFRDAQVTLAYMPPERLYNENHPAGPWWSLGNIVFELVSGHPRYANPDGGMVADEVLQRDLVMRDEADLSRIGDERFALLLRGLFTKEPDDRWTYPQVQDWLVGGNPEVVRARPADHPPARANRPITFRGQPYDTPGDLAAAMLTRSRDAAAWLAGDGAEALRTWLVDEVKDLSFDVTHLRHGRLTEQQAALVVLVFGAAYAPHLPPRYRERGIDAESLPLIAASGAEGTAFLRELLDQHVLTIAATYRCEHPGCAERCAVLARVQDEVPRIVKEVARAVPGPDLTGDRTTTGHTTAQMQSALREDERAVAYQLATELTVRPNGRGAVLAQIRSVPGASLPVIAPGVAADPVARWWSNLHQRARHADTTTVAGRTALVTAAVLHPRVVTSRAETLAQVRERRRKRAQVRWQVWSLRLAAGGALCLAGALLFWSGSVLAQSVAMGNKLDVTPDGAFSGPLRGAGGTGAAVQYVLLPVAITAAMILAAFPRVSRGKLVVAGVVAGLLGFQYPHPQFPAFGRLPTFTAVQLPESLHGWLGAVQEPWGRWCGLAALLVYPAAAVAVGRGAASLLVRSAAVARTADAGGSGVRGAGNREYWAPGRRGANVRWAAGVGGVAQRTEFALTSMALLVAVLWTTVVVRLTVTAEVPHGNDAVAGVAAAGHVSAYLPALALSAAASCLWAPRRARVLLGWATAGTLLLGLLPDTTPGLRPFQHPVAEHLVGGLAGTWGGQSFWAALLLGLPLAVFAGHLASIRPNST
jgi:hypothetical protein